MFEFSNRLHTHLVGISTMSVTEDGIEHVSDHDGFIATPADDGESPGLTGCKTIDDEFAGGLRHEEVSIALRLNSWI